MKTSPFCSSCSFKPQPLLQRHVSDQLPDSRHGPDLRRPSGLLFPRHVPVGFLLPAARYFWALLLARQGGALRPVLPLYPAEVRGGPRARGAAALLHHGSVLHDGTRGSVLASGRRGRFTGRENRPPGHSGPAAQHQTEPCHRQPGAPRGAVDSLVGRQRIKTLLFSTHSIRNTTTRYFTGGGAKLDLNTML